VPESPVKVVLGAVGYDDDVFVREIVRVAMQTYWDSAGSRSVS
jgi:hypothetical protein